VIAMPIIVKKPFSFSIDDIKSEDIKDINDTANRVEQVHPEFEEKPIMATTQTSENSHGGSELTFSIDSSQSSGQEQKNGNNQAVQNNTSTSNNADTNNDNTNDNAADNSDNKGAQEQHEKSNDNNEMGDNAVNTDVDKRDNESNNNTHGTNADKQESGGDNDINGTQGTQEPQSINDTNDQSAQVQENANAESNGDNQSEGDNSNNGTEDQGQESSNEGGENDSESTSTEPGSSVDNGDGDTNGTNATDNDVSNQGQENGDNDEQNSENDGEDEDEESEGEEVDEQAQSGTYNTQQVVDVINAVSASSKYYQTEFWRLIELIAEEKTRTYDPIGSEEYNIKKLMFRPYEKKPLSSYKMSRVRESVVILLDNSGSMEWWAGNLQILADLAMQRNDVEVYLAPNGHIEEMLYPKYQLVNHDDVIKRLRNRKIIYVGDFDGADTPIILSWYNDVIWICPEERYLNFLEHDWVHYDESKFKGAFLRVFTLQELFDAFKKLLSTPALKIWYDLCNETHKCGGDEE